MQNSKKTFYIVLVLLVSLVGIIFYQSLQRKKSQPPEGEIPAVKTPSIVLESPKAGDVLDGKIVIKGTVKGWFFEGSFPYYLKDSDGNIISAGPIQSKGEWMTAEPVAFDQTVEFFTDKTEGVLVLQKDNPSDDRSLDEKIEIPVKFVPSEGMKLNVFFGNSIYNPNQIDCGKVYPVVRTVKKDPKTATMAIKELLKGTTYSELQEGYSTSLNSGIELNKLTIANGEAKVDFNSVLGEGVAGSCRVGQIRAQIESTLKQFPTVTSVVISIDGVSEGILQP